MRLTHLPTHILLFDQVDSGKSRIRAFLCRRIDERNLCIMLELYYASFDEKLSAKDRYEWSLLWSLLYTSSCLLRNCFRGSTFPFSLSRKRPRSTFHIIVDNNSCVKECFTFVDCIKSSDCCDPICVV